MGTGRIFFALFFAAISCAWGYDDAQDPNPWIPELLHEDDNWNFPEVNSFNDVLEPMSYSDSDQGTIEEFRSNREASGEMCGEVDLSDNIPVIISSSNLTFTKKRCIWKFNAIVPDSTIYVECFVLATEQCKKSFLIVKGKKYCFKNEMVKVSFDSDIFSIVYKITTPPSDLVFLCKITAKRPITTTSSTTTSSTTTTPTTSSTTTSSTTTSSTTTTSTTPTPTTTPPKCSKFYKLKPGKSVTIKSKEFPKNFPKDQNCTWKFKGTSMKSKISIVCKPFTLLNCKETSLTVTGKNLNKKFCGKKKSIMASSSNNEMEVVFQSKKKSSKGFKCKVTASKIPEKPTCKPCGTVNRAKRIVGGVETEKNEYPWQVAIVYTGTNLILCSGSIYNDLYVMTAAHCALIISLTGSMAEVLLGAHDLNNLGLVQRIAVSMVITDGFYNAPTSFDHDIALLKLAKRATLSDNVKPACLPNPSNTYSGDKATVTGWGQTAEVGITSSVLMEVEVPVISNAACTSVYNGYVTDNILCTHSPNGGKDKCYSDGGAPLAKEENGKWVVIGVGSWGVGCGQKGFPAGYERVSRHLDFLSSNAALGKNDLCS